MESALVYTKQTLRQYGLKAKKSLGQNFLIDDSIIHRIIDESEVRTGDIVLEIGPGIGVLTRALVDTGARIWAVELDNTLTELLRDRFNLYSNIKIIHGDALKLTISELGLPVQRLKVIANLPYYITSPLLKHFLDQRQFIESLTLMVQHEVAQRIVARPSTKDYGILTLAVQAFCDTEILFTVPPNSFLPQPKVDSAVVRLKVSEKAKVTREREFFTTVKAAFGQRRKTMVNALSQGLKRDKDSIITAMNEANLNPMCRAENLSLQDFVRLSEALWLTEPLIEREN